MLQGSMFTWEVGRWLCSPTLASCKTARKLYSVKWLQKCDRLKILFSFMFFCSHGTY
nr:MAG TPA: hypothetical protein [Caudoviricetes sp.]